MGAIAESLAEPSVFAHKGVEYPCSPFVFAVQAAFEKYIEAYAVQSFQRVSHLLSPEDAERGLASIMRDITAGRYSFGSAPVEEALRSPLHLKRLFFLCLKKLTPAVTPELVEEMARENYQGMIAALNAANASADPNRMAPADAADAGARTTTSSPAVPNSTTSASA